MDALDATDPPLPIACNAVAVDAIVLAIPIAAFTLFLAIIPSDILIPP